MIAKLTLVLLVGSFSLLVSGNKDLNEVLDKLFNKGQETMDLEETFEQLQLADSLASSATGLDQETQQKVDLVRKLIPLNELDETACEAGDLGEYISLGNVIMANEEHDTGVPNAFAYVKIHQQKRYSYCVKQELLVKLEFIGLADQRNMISLQKLVTAGYSGADEENNPSDPLIEAISSHVVNSKRTTFFKNKEELIEKVIEYYNRYDEIVVSICQTVHDTLDDFRQSYKPYESLLEWYTRTWMSIVDTCNAILSQPDYYADRSYQAQLDMTPSAAFLQRY